MALFAILLSNCAQVGQALDSYVAQADAVQQQQVAANQAQRAREQRLLDSTRVSGGNNNYTLEGEAYRNVLLRQKEQQIMQIQEAERQRAYQQQQYSRSPQGMATSAFAQGRAAAFGQ